MRLDFVEGDLCFIMLFLINTIRKLQYEQCMHRHDAPFKPNILYSVELIMSKQLAWCSMYMLQTADVTWHANHHAMLHVTCFSRRFRAALLVFQNHII